MATAAEADPALIQIDPASPEFEAVQDIFSAKAIGRNGTGEVRYTLVLESVARLAADAPSPAVSRFLDNLPVGAFASEVYFHRVRAGGIGCLEGELDLCRTVLWEGLQERPGQFWHGVHVSASPDWLFATQASPQCRAAISAVSAAQDNQLPILMLTSACPPQRARGIDHAVWIAQAAKQLPQGIDMVHPAWESRPLFKEHVFRGGLLLPRYLLRFRIRTDL